MNWLILVVKYLPTVISLVQGVEASIGSQAPGTAKKQIVLDAIKAGAQAGEAIPDAHVAAVSTLIDSTVTTLNASKSLGFGK